MNGRDYVRRPGPVHGLPSLLAGVGIWLVCLCCLALCIVAGFGFLGVLITICT